MSNEPKHKLVMSDFDSYHRPWSPEEGSAAHKRMIRERYGITLKEIIGDYRPAFDVDSFRLGGFTGRKELKLHWELSPHCVHIQSDRLRKAASKRILLTMQFFHARDEEKCTVCKNDYQQYYAAKEEGHR
jgi:hypothetical protein